jgi:hypothetical protein
VSARRIEQTTVCFFPAPCDRCPLCARAHLIYGRTGIAGEGARASFFERSAVAPLGLIEMKRLQSTETPVS